MCAVSLAGLVLATASVLPSCGEVCDACEGGQPEEMAALQMRALGRDAWASKTTSRDLATVPPPQELILTCGQKVYLHGAVPSQGPEGFFMALLFQYGEKQWEALQKAGLQCYSLDGYHRAPARMFGGEKQAPYKRMIALHCAWPQEEANRGVYDIRLIEADGHEMGQVQASYRPGLLKQYGTAACINNIWNGQVATLKLTPPWMEFQLMHGVDHFFVYTQNGTDVTVLELYEPYIAAGVATRVHLNTPDKALSKGYDTHGWMTNDCLYRAKGHVRWLMPTVDVDEYIRFRPGLSTRDYLRSVWDRIANNRNGTDGKPDNRQVYSISLTRVNFERAGKDPDLEISAIYRYATSFSCPKPVVNVPLVHALFIHWPTSWVDGAVEHVVDMKDGFVNHYRDSKTFNALIPDDAAPVIRDDALLVDIPAVSMALEERFGHQWKAFAAKLKNGSSISIAQQAVGETFVFERGCACRPDVFE